VELPEAWRPRKSPPLPAQSLWITHGTSDPGDVLLRHIWHYLDGVDPVLGELWKDAVALAERESGTDNPALLLEAMLADFLAGHWSTRGKLSPRRG
jgi:hypothetical protein